MTSSPLFAVALYSTVMTTTLVPLSRASVSQWLSGILVVIQFMPQTRTSCGVLGVEELEVRGLVAV